MHHHCRCKVQISLHCNFHICQLRVAASDFNSFQSILRHFNVFLSFAVITVWSTFLLVVSSTSKNTSFNFNQWNNTKNCFSIFVSLTPPTEQRWLRTKSVEELFTHDNENYFYSLFFLALLTHFYRIADKTIRSFAKKGIGLELLQNHFCTHSVPPHRMKLICVNSTFPFSW